MDDVLLMADNEKDLQTLLNITVNTANKYHIVFGEEKSKIMIMNSKKELKNTMKLGNMTLKTTENYKYLGEIINHKKSMKNQISESKRKAEGALQTILTIAGDPTLKGIQMETIWKLIETCIIPISTYACELWDPNKEEKGTINRILDNLIKRVLMVPTSIPRQNSYIETGIRDMTHNMTHRRINMLCRLETTNSNMITSILEIENPKSWTNSTIKIMQDMGINPNITTKKENITTKRNTPSPRKKTTPK